jgi:hypothetical protein
MDSKDLKSILTSFSIILLYFYATAGIVKLIMNTDDEYQFDGRVKFMFLLQILFFFVYVVGMYYLVGPYRINDFYLAYVIFQIAYVVIGVFSNSLIKNK